MIASALPEGGTLVDRAAAAFTRYQGGERDALDDLVALVTPLLWRTVRAAGLDRNAAEDVVQTVWLRLLHGADNVRDAQSVVKWLITAARREAWRAGKRSRAELDRAAPLPDDGDPVRDLPEPRDGMGLLPDEVVLRTTRERRLWEHVRGLPDRCRQLISVIAFADRPDYTHIAESLGMPVGSIGPTRGRCLAKLRDRLAGDPGWEGLS